MYEMYPQAWASGDPDPTTVPTRPRRRPRKDHSVLPPVLVRHVQAELRRSSR